MRKRLIRLAIRFLSWMGSIFEGWIDRIDSTKDKLLDKLRPPTEYVVIGEIGTGRTFRYAKGWNVPSGFQLLYDHIPAWAKELPVKTLELREFDAILRGHYLNAMKEQLNGQSIWGTSPIEPLIHMQMAYGRNTTVTTNHTKEMNEDEV